MNVEVISKTYNDFDNIINEYKKYRIIIDIHYMIDDETGDTLALIYYKEK